MDYWIIYSCPPLSKNSLSFGQENRRGDGYIIMYGLYKDVHKFSHRTSSFLKLYYVQVSEIKSILQFNSCICNGNPGNGCRIKAQTG